jgi:predicted Zn-ribbon and HTH transcriptional regulator
MADGDDKDHWHIDGSEIQPDEIEKGFPPAYKGVAIDRLAAYEDTGMTPAECLASREEVKWLEAELLEARAEIERLKQDNDAVKKWYKSACDQAQRWQDSYTTLKNQEIEELADLTAELKALKAERDELVMKLRASLSKNKAATATIKELKGALSKAAKMLADAGQCTHYPGYTCDKDFPAACPECISKWLRKLAREPTP